MAVTPAPKPLRRLTDAEIVVGDTVPDIFIPGWTSRKRCRNHGDDFSVPYLLDEPVVAHHPLGAGAVPQGVPRPE